MAPKRSQTPQGHHTDALRDKLADGVLDTSQTEEDLAKRDSVVFNRAILITWPIFSMFLLTQPWLSNWANNNLHSYSADYAVYGDQGQLQGVYRRAGICVTPAQEMHCTDGQNFTALALKYRGVPLGCGCGQGILGEGLCPMTSYGHTLSDFVSTAPGIAAMLGLGFFPLIGAWINTGIINKKARPHWLIGAAHHGSMMIFQVSYIMWGVCSACIFPTSHSVLTVVFLGTYVVHWVITAIICCATWGFDALEARVTFVVAIFSITIMGLGSIPRVFLVLNDLVGSPLFPNWNRGLGSYAFWFAEAAGLSATFGAYPICIIGFCHPSFVGQKPPEFCIFFHEEEKKKSK
mmetsp:Transcript_19687/g.42861  ORF Transcript_19687/g.42861 Transcript_19687/m.42861 type:complete len:348 (-) Transcript_19687:104-1147(-)